MNRRRSIAASPSVLLLMLALMPASSFAAAAPSTTNGKPATGADSGTTIVGDGDAAVGLYLTPWKEESAADIDRAPGLLDQRTLPANGRAFKQQIDNDDALAAYRRTHLEQGH